MASLHGHSLAHQDSSDEKDAFTTCHSSVEMEASAHIGTGVPSPRFPNHFPPIKEFGQKHCHHGQRSFPGTRNSESTMSLTVRSKKVVPGESSSVNNMICLQLFKLPVSVGQGMFCGLCSRNRTARFDAIYAPGIPLIDVFTRKSEHPG
jgi:hypothetical protein